MADAGSGPGDNAYSAPGDWARLREQQDAELREAQLQDAARLRAYERQRETRQQRRRRAAEAAETRRRQTALSNEQASEERPEKRFKRAQKPPLPYDGDMNKAMQAQDRDAIRILMEARQQQNKQLHQQHETRQNTAAAAAAAAAAAGAAQSRADPRILQKLRELCASKEYTSPWFQLKALAKSLGMRSFAPPGTTRKELCFKIAEHLQRGGLSVTPQTLKT
jgi:hypothetical protein